MRARKTTILTAAAAAALSGLLHADARTTVIDYGQLKISLMTETIARVTFQAEDADLPQKYYAAVPDPSAWPAVAFTEEERGSDLVVISTKGMAISVNTSSLLCAFRDLATGEEVLREVSRGLRPTVDTDAARTETYVVEQSWERLESERIYGGGEYQSGFLARAGAPLELVQRNTEAALPYFMSSRGYGILWDNAARTWLNWPSEELPLTSADSRGSKAVAGAEGSVLPREHVGTVEASSSGTHYFTIYCDGIDYGASGASTARLFLTDLTQPAAAAAAAAGRDGDNNGGRNGEKEGEKVVVIDWHQQHNKPPSLSGFAELEEGHSYALALETFDCCVPFKRTYKAGGFRLLVSRPPAQTPSSTTTTTTTLRSALGDFVDYYVAVAGSTDTSAAGGSTAFDTLVAQYRTLTGPAPLLGKWAYGFWQCKEHYHNRSEIEDAAKEFRRRGLPVDNFVQDWKYWGAYGWSPVWDESLYPDPAGMVKELHDTYDVRFMVSVWSKFQNRQFLEPLRRGGELLDAASIWMDAYDPAAKADFFAFANASMFSIGVDALWLDATEPEGFPHVDKTVYPYGRKAPPPPPSSSSSSSSSLSSPGLPMSANALLNGYSLEVTGSVHDGLRRHYPDRRVFSLTRSASAGQQRYGAALWSGDISGSWDMLRRQVGAALSFQLSGSPYWAQDIGGFFRPDDQYDPDSPYAELLVRWFQFGAFCPLYRVHGDNSSTELWNYGDDTMAAVNATTTLRYRLLPYIYSLAKLVDAPSASASSAGSAAAKESSAMESLGAGLVAGHYTMQRALAFDFGPSDPSVHDLAINGGSEWPDEFMFGPALLVAPMLWPASSSSSSSSSSASSSSSSSSSSSGASAGVAKRNVYLPISSSGSDNNNSTGQPGVFYDFWTGDRYDGGALLQDVEAPIDRLPLYGRGGSLLVLGPELQWSGQQQQQGGPWFIDVRVYAGADASFELYEDNGVDHAYEEKDAHEGKGGRGGRRGNGENGDDSDGGQYKITPLSWSDATRTLTVGAQQGYAGSVAGVPDERTLRVFLVRPGHGVGTALDQQPDVEVSYNGTEVAVIL